MQCHPSPYLPVNHVFVDLENVRTIDASVLGANNLTFHLFIGPQNKKLDVDVVEALLENSQAVKLIRSQKAGKNALDFVLAYHLGQAVLGDPRGYFHIVSKDTGFDSLVELLKSKQVKVKRHDDWSQLNFSAISQTPVVTKEPEAKGLSADAAKMLADLKKTAASRPKRKKGLLGRASSVLGKGSTDELCEKVTLELVKAGHLSLDDKGAVKYVI